MVGIADIRAQEEALVGRLVLRVILDRDFPVVKVSEGVPLRLVRVELRAAGVDELHGVTVIREFRGADNVVQTGLRFQKVGVVGDLVLLRGRQLVIRRSRRLDLALALRGDRPADGRDQVLHVHDRGVPVVARHNGGVIRSNGAERVRALRLDPVFFRLGLRGGLFFLRGGLRRGFFFCGLCRRFLLFGRRRLFALGGRFFFHYDRRVFRVGRAFIRSQCTGREKAQRHRNDKQQ